MLDKTGTVTEGRPLVSALETREGWSEERILQLIASIEAGSEHPLAGAIMAATEAKKLALLPVEDFQAIAGWHNWFNQRQEKLISDAHWIELTGTFEIFDQRQAIREAVIQ